MNEYDIYQEVKSLVVGECKCTICGSKGNLVLREGKQFKYWFCECPSGHRPGIKEVIDDVFQIGDRVRIYEAPFDVKKKIDFTSYIEGVVVSKEKSIVCYNMDVKIDKVVHHNKEIRRSSFLYGHISRGIPSDSNLLELLTPQLKFEIKE